MQQAHSKQRETVRHETFWRTFLVVQRRIVKNAGYGEVLACMHAYGITSGLIDNNLSLDNIKTISDSRFREAMATQPEYQNSPPGWEEHMLRALRLDNADPHLPVLEV